MRKVAMKQLTILALMMFLILELMVMAIPLGMAQPHYGLKANIGDWVEYRVVDAENFVIGGHDVNTGDTVKFVVVSLETEEVTDASGTTLCTFTYAVCNIYVNGELAAEEESFSWLVPFAPTDIGFWSKLKQAAESAGIDFTYETGFFEIKTRLVFLASMENKVDTLTGVVTWFRMSLGTLGRAEMKWIGTSEFLLWFSYYWWIWVIGIVVLIIIIAVIVVLRRRRRPAYPPY
ncbi:MAG TPA: hypothetical protein ENF78_00315, partial [Candidatus Bathyarchaeota archaeon]|nr:hypothetical protein [Candidatus Bathyarchaeota archaeon]